jgi:hypothetical protein
MTDAPDIETVDREYEKRWAWWAFVPHSEREEFSAAEREGDRKTIYKLTKRGKRREEKSAYDICNRRTVSTKLGYTFVWDDDDPTPGFILLENDEGDRGCVCLSRALDSSVSDVHRLALALHADPDLTVDRWIATERRKQKAKAKVPDPSTTTLHRTPPTDLPPADPRPIGKPATPEPPLRAASTRPRRWYDDGDGSLLERVF